jgi:hypothetical protein
MCSGHTSENAGAAIFLNFFHSSPSEVMMFAPKTASILYRYTGLGNLARWVVTSYQAKVEGIGSDRLRVGIL